MARFGPFRCDLGTRTKLVPNEPPSDGRSTVRGAIPAPRRTIGYVMREVKFQRDKFRELIVYIAERTKDDPSFGDVKLNKALYWSDVYGYTNLGRPVTGAKYQKETWGPVAAALVPVRQELEAEGRLRVEKRWVGSKWARVTVAVPPEADTSLFTREELEIVDEVIRQMGGQTAVGVSGDSHRESVGWNLVEMGEEIPYSSSLISKEAPSKETLARVRKAAARLGW
jgi:hypothetical protein